MKELIDKAAIVAEIEKRVNEYPCDNSEQDIGYHCALYEMEDFINSLKVKEVDLEEAARHYLLHEHISPLNEILHQADIRVEMQYHTDIEDAYKAGFELGLKTKEGE